MTNLKSRVNKLDSKQTKAVNVVFVIEGVIAFGEFEGRSLVSLSHAEHAAIGHTVIVTKLPYV